MGLKLGWGSKPATTTQELWGEVAKLREALRLQSKSSGLGCNCGKPTQVTTGFQSDVHDKCTNTFVFEPSNTLVKTTRHTPTAGPHVPC